MAPEHGDFFIMRRPRVRDVGEDGIPGREAVLLGEIQEASATPRWPAGSNLRKRGYFIGMPNQRVGEVLAQPKNRDCTHNGVLMAEHGGVAFRTCEGRAQK